MEGGKGAEGIECVGYLVSININPHDFPRRRKLLKCLLSLSTFVHLGKHVGPYCRSDRFWENSV